MSDGEDRDQPASPLRRQQAREQGHVARSPDLIFALVFAAAGGGLAWKGPELLKWLAHDLKNGLRDAATSTRDPWDLVEQCTQLTAHGIHYLAPLLLFIMLASVAGHWIQHGPLWLPQKLTLDFSQLSLARGWNRLGSGAQPIRFALGIFRIAAMAGVTWYWWRAHLETMAALAHLPSHLLVRQASHWILHLMACYAGVLLLLGAIDFGFRVWRREQSLMVSSVEERDEIHEVRSDGRRKRRAAPGPMVTDNQTGLHRETSAS